MLDVNGDKVTYNKVDLPTGQWPYNVVVTPNSKIALTSDNGGAGSSDGSVDTTSVIDLEANPPRIIDRVVVGDGPEGLAMSPKGDVAVAAILRGSNMKKAFFYNKNGSLSILKIDGKKVTKTQDIEVGGLPEAVAFTPDGKYLLAGNYLNQDFSILKVNGTQGHRYRQALQGAGSSGLGPHGALGPRRAGRCTKRRSAFCFYQPQFKQARALELPHRFAAREQAFGGVVGRHFDQRTIHLDAALTRGAGGFERRDEASARDASRRRPVKVCR